MRRFIFIFLLLLGTGLYALTFVPPIDDYDPTQDISSPFLERESVMGGGDDTVHLGVDLVPKAIRENRRANAKTYAVADGEVITCYPPPGAIGYTKAGKKFTFPGHPVYGGLLVIRHWDDKAKMYCYSLYGHLKEIWVSEGTMVKAGHPLGFIGSTGRSTGPHLHFAIYYDPLDVINSAIMAQKKNWFGF